MLAPLGDAPDGSSLPFPAMRHTPIALLLTAVLVAACSSTSTTPVPGSAPPSAGPSVATGAPPSGTPSGTPGAPTDVPGTNEPPATEAPPTAEPTPAGPTLSPEAQALLGTDGRWTVLLLGTDARPPLIGHRTDLMIVATVDPIGGRVVAVSLPRDTAQVPIADGETWQPKVNLLFQHFLDQQGNKAAAAQKLVEAFSYTFGVEIDDYAFIDFTGVIRAINAIDGVDVTLDARIDDPNFVNPDGSMGIHLKAGLNHLNGQKALAFARTRHQDTDYQRSRRQQQLISAAIEKVRGLGLDAVPRLLTVAEEEITTDISLASAPAIMEVLSRADLEGRKTIVLGPTKWATSPIRYTNVLRIDVVRQFFASAFAPVE